MSRAFVKEQDGDEVDAGLPERQQSDHPNYITLRGVEDLKTRIAAMRARRQELETAPEALSAKSELQILKSELSYLEKRLQSAIPVDPAEQAMDVIRFGATVALVDADGARHSFTIVGEDEADVATGKVSWMSPLAKAMMGARVGDTVKWRRPAGEVELEVQEIRY